jgi:hypothetical protein
MMVNAIQWMDGRRRFCRAGRLLIVAVVGAVLIGAVSAAAATPGTALWVRHYDAHSEDLAQAMAVSPDGSKLYVTGYSSGAAGYDYATVAYSLLGGAQLWARRYNDPSNGDDFARVIAVSPDGSRVFVTGQSTGATSATDYVTVGYDAASGATLWVRRYSGPGVGQDYADALATSPDGSKVFVTGESVGVATHEDYATVAYNARTGARLWIQRYNGPGDGYDLAHSIAVSPDGRTAFVTGTASDSADYTTIAYDTSTGARRWLRRYSGLAGFANEARSVAVSPDGSSVFVTGQSAGADFTTDYATVAYDASTGATIWVRRSSGPGISGDSATALVPSSDGSSVFVTGISGGAFGDDYLTVAYAASTGNTRWARRYNGPGNLADDAYGIAVSPDGASVFVTGSSFGTTSGDDYATVAYDTSTGATRWIRRYNGAWNDTDVATAVATSPDGSNVLVTGYSRGASFDYDYVTVAYAAAAP